MGTMKKEGYFEKVLSMLECRVATRAMMSPGDKDARTEMMMFWEARRVQYTQYTFPSRLKKLTQMMKKNLPEKRLVPGKILQGPVFRTFDKPKADVKKDDAKVTEKKDWSYPISKKMGDSRS